MILMRKGFMTDKSYQVLVIGYGEMGHAMEFLLQDRHQLTFHDCRSIDGLQAIDLEDVAARSDFVLFCLPTNPHMEVLQRIAPHLPPHCICLSIAKGLDDHGRSAAQCFEESLAGQGQPYCVLYGPMISEEIRANRYAFAQVGCTDTAVFETVGDLYRGTDLYIHHSMDIVGLSWSVILKNVYAIAFGAADELRLGDNMRGFLAVKALGELSEIVEQKGGRPSTPYHLAGLGDLITTATSRDSHHHELGRRLARGERRDISGEGVFTLEMVDKHALFDTATLPLYNLIRHVVGRTTDVAAAIRDFVRTTYQI